MNLNFENMDYVTVNKIKNDELIRLSIFRFKLCFYMTEALYLLCYVKRNWSFIQRILMLQRK